MTHEGLAAFFEEFTRQQRLIFEAKGKSYSGVGEGEEGDRLANFRRIAERLPGVSPLMVWLVYFLKHVDSVCTYVTTGHESEGMRNRCLDLANYAILGAALDSDDPVK